MSSRTVFVCARMRVCIFNPSLFVCSFATLAVREDGMHMSVYGAPWWSGASSVSWQWGCATPALAISMSFHGVPQWLLGDFIIALDLSLHQKMTTPCGMMHSVDSESQLHLNLWSWFSLSSFHQHRYKDNQRLFYILTSNCQPSLLLHMQLQYFHNWRSSHCTPHLALQ